MITRITGGTHTGPQFINIVVEGDEPAEEMAARYNEVKRMLDLEKEEDATE